MPKRISPKPEAFARPQEEHYWHMAQDTAFRAGAALVEQAGATWLVFGDERELIVKPGNTAFLWFETWRALHDKYQGLSRLWIDGHPLDP